MRWCHDEPTLDEMLADPLIGVLMHADGVDREQLGADLARVAGERQERGAFRLLIGGQAFPFRPADGTEENRLRRAASFQGMGRQRVVELVDGRAADGIFLGLNGEAEFLRGGVKDIKPDGHDFRSNAVTGEDGDFVGVAHKKGKDQITKFFQINEILKGRGQISHRGLQGAAEAEGEGLDGITE